MKLAMVREWPMHDRRQDTSMLMVRMRRAVERERVGLSSRRPSQISKSLSSRPSKARCVFGDLF
jgi:hypothetical protein